MSASGCGLIFPGVEGWHGAVMIPPRKFTHGETGKQTTVQPVRSSNANLQRMKARLQSLKGVPKLAYCRRVEE